MVKQTPAIEIDQLSKVYSDRKEQVVAIQEVSLTIPEGKFVSIVGPSGCGKSTFLHIIGGFIPKSNGTVRIRGKEVDKPGPDRGMMFQESALFPWKTVSENVAWGLEVQGVPKAERQKTVEHYLKHSYGMVWNYGCNKCPHYIFDRFFPLFHCYARWCSWSKASVYLGW